MNWKKLITEKTKEAIEKDLSVVELIKEYLEDFKFIAKHFLRARWNEIEHYLKNPHEFIEKYCDDEKLKSMLLSKKGKEWLQKNCRQLYDYLYNFAWK